MKIRIRGFFVILLMLHAVALALRVLMLHAVALALQRGSNDTLGTLFCLSGVCMNRELFRNNILELIRRTSAFLPPDVEAVINLQRKLESAGSKADFALELVAQNIGLAKARSLPICQDTGTINFFFETPAGVDQLELEELCKDAVKEATAKGYLRQNSVDSVDGTNTGDNLGPGSPVFHWEQTRDSNVHVRLILKGGGCENMSAQYSLPAEIQGKRVDRNIEGVRACILDAIWKRRAKGAARASSE